MHHAVYDVETDGLYRHKGATMFAYATAEWDRRDVDGASVDVRRLDGPQDRRAGSRRRLEELWSEDGKRRYSKVAHNARFDVGFTQDCLGRDLRGHEVHETMALSHIFDNMHYSHKLDDLAWDLFGFPRHDARVKPYIATGRGLLDCPEWLLGPYQEADVVCTMLLFQLYHPKLAECGYEEIYEMERRLVWTTLSIENRGVMISRRRCGAMQDWLRGESDAALSDYRSLGGSHGTPLGNDLPRVLARMGFPLEKKTRGGRNSTDRDVIIELREKTHHPIFDAILRYRSYSRGVATIDGYLDAADGEGAVHPQIHPYRAKTGREACAHPNLQNVSKETTLRSPYPIPARRVFVPRPGHVNFHVDYSGIEARLLVHFSRDEEALAIFRDGRDFHAEAACELYGETFTNVSKRRDPKRWKALRDAGKNADFAIGFGARPKKVAVTLNVSPAEGRAGYERFRRRFPAYAAMPLRFAEVVRRDGCVRTIFGRKLSLPRDKPYVGTNYVVQGCLQKRSRILTDHGYLTIDELLARDHAEYQVWTGRSFAPFVVLNRGPAELMDVHFKDGRVLHCDVRHEVRCHTLMGYSGFRRITSLPSCARACVARPQEIEFKEPKMKDWSESGQSWNAIWVTITEDDLEGMWYWVGRWIGDGSAGGRSHPGAFNICFSMKERNAARSLRKFMFQFGMDVRLKDKINDIGGRSISANWTSIAMKKFWAEVLGVTPGQTARTKRVPSRLWISHAKHRRSFLRGLYDADGCKTGAQNLHMMNHTLLSEVQLLYDTIGVYTRLRGPFPSCGSSTLQLNVGKGKYYLLDHDYHYAVLNECRRLGKTEDTFTLEVGSRLHQFTSNGIISKNTAAGILKRAQNRVDEYLLRATGGEAAIILPIHDEIVIEWPRARLGEARACLREIRDLMVDFPQLTVPLEVEVDVSTRDWASAREYDLGDKTA